MLGLLKMGASGLQELNYEAIEAMTSAEFVQSLNDKLRQRISIFKIKVEEVSGSTVNKFLVFHLIIGERIPAFYLGVTYERQGKTFWFDQEIGLSDIKKIADFVSDEKQIAAGQGDYVNAVASEKAPVKYFTPNGSG